MARKNKKNDTDFSAAVTMARLERLARLMRQANHGHGLVPVQWEVLRYLARANRLSNTPGAVARYLGSTKGTVSQTVLYLEKKGLLGKQSRPDDERFTALVLTDAARKLLASDPLAALAEDIGELGGKTQKRFARGVTVLLEKEVSRRNEPQFGSCPTCRYFREGGPDQPLACMKDNASLSVSEMSLICVEYVGR